MNKAQLKLKQALENQNFWIAFVLMIGGFWMWRDSETTGDLVNKVFVVIAGVATIGNYIKDSDFNFKEWIVNANFWNYLAVIVTMIIPTIPADGITAIQDLVTNLLGGNTEGLIASIFTLATFIYKVVTTKPNPEINGGGLG